MRLAENRESFAAKLLLSSVLVAVSLAYGLWQRNAATRPIIAMAPVPLPAAPKSLWSAQNGLAKPVPASTTPAAPATPDFSAAAGLSSASKQTEATPTAPRSASIARAAPRATKATAIHTAPAARLPQNVASPSPAPTAALSAQVAQEMYMPTDEASPPLPLVTGTPSPGATPSIPTGTHLEDGDYLSDRHQFEWGDLEVKISIHEGQITGVQILQYPDHRSQSLYLSQMAGPILENEVIKTQQYQVDVVTSATDTSYAFQDAIAGAIVKATRG